MAGERHRHRRSSPAGPLRRAVAQTFLRQAGSLQRAGSGNLFGSLHHRISGTGEHLFLLLPGGGEIFCSAPFAERPDSGECRPAADEGCLETGGALFHQFAG